MPTELYEYYASSAVNKLKHCSCFATFENLPLINIPFWKIHQLPPGRLCEMCKYGSQIAGITC